MHSEPSAESIEFYRVGFACEAAPKIGCGMRAKPVLQSLERMEGVTGAWLSRSGTFLAVRWKPPSKDSNARVLSAVAAEDCACIEPVADVAERRRISESLAAGRDWYRADDIDQLSIEEASIIAERVMRRIAAKAALEPSQSARLARTIAEACARFLTSEAPGTVVLREERLRRVIIDAGRPELSSEHHGVLEAAAASGHRPLAGER